MNTEQNYGPHSFGPAECPSGTDAVIATCACGAMEGAVAGCGPVISPAPNPLPDPTQCRLNPLPSFKLEDCGPHQYGDWEDPQDTTLGKTIIRRCQCGSSEFIIAQEKLYADMTGRTTPIHWGRPDENVRSSSKHCPLNPPPKS